MICDLFSLMTYWKQHLRLAEQARRAGIGNNTQTRALVKYFQAVYMSMHKGEVIGHQHADFNLSALQLENKNGMAFYGTS